MAMVSFDPTSYTVVEGTDPTANLMLVRSGDLSRSVVVTVFTNPGTANGIVTPFTCIRFSSCFYMHTYPNISIHRCKRLHICFKDGNI